MNKSALYFPDEDYFVSYVRSLNANVAGEFILYHLAAFSNQTGGLILVGIDTTESPTLALQAVTIDRVADSSKTLKQAHKIIHFKNSIGAHQATVIGEVKKFYILDLLTLRKSEQASTHNAYFWISDLSLLKQIITQSIRLGNDHIQLAELQDDTQITHLVKIENPSYFLIQTALEDFDSSINIYYPIMDNVFIAWGYTHPLEDIWRKSKKTRQQWTFIDYHNQSHKVEPIQWTDIYEFLNFDFDIPGLQTSTLKTTAIDPLTIPLQLITKSSDSNPSMWLVQGADLVNLESLLTVIDQDDLASYVVNISEDNTGEKLIFIREKHKKNNELFIDFSSQSFANFKGFQNLYLPTQLDFQPNVRRDTYRHLFSLKAGENTVLLGKDDTRIIKISDAGFRPLSRYVNYIIEQSLETLQTVVEESYFDLSIYTKLAKTGYSDSQPSTSRPLIANEADNDSQGNAKQSNDRNNKEPIRQLFGKSKHSNNNQTIESKQQFEIEAERNIIKDPSLQHWQALVDIKQSLQRDQDLENCIVGLIWMLPPGKAQKYFSLWHALVLQAAQDSSSKSTTTAAKELVLSIEHIAEENLSQWLHQSINALKSVEKNLKVKERWLLWHIILHKNHDTREQARLQEEIRDTISQGTIDYIEIPEFIRSRIFTDRLINTSNKDDYDVAIANGNLDLLFTALLTFDKMSIKMSSAAIITRIYTREMNRDTAAIEILHRLSGGNTNTLKTIASVDIMKLLEKFMEACSAPFRVWAGLYLLHSFPNVNKLKQYYEKLLSECDDSLKNKLETLNELLEQREKSDNPLALLSEKNRNRYYPKGTIYEQGPLAEASTQLRKVALTADKTKIKEVLRSVLENIDPTNDDMQLARLIAELTRLLNFIKMDDDSKPILESFLIFANKASSQETGGIPLYKVLRQSNLAEALIQIAHKKQATDTLTYALVALRTTSSELDFIDSCSSIISTIECFDLKERASLLEPLLVTIKLYLGEDRYYSNNLHVDWLRLIDQIAEACISKDKLSMNLFSHFQQQDEFIILNRILNESIN